MICIRQNDSVIDSIVINCILIIIWN